MAIAGKRCQGDGETAHRRPIGVAVAWSGSRAVLNHRQAGQGDGETAHRRPIGVAAAWSWCRAAGRHRLPACARVAAGVARSVAMLEHRQFGRVFVLSIGEAGHEATTAPVSSGAWWRSPASGARATARRHTDGRSGLPRPGQGAGLLAGIGCRRGPCCGGARSPANWRCCGQGVQLVGQFGRAFVLSIGEAGHEATTAPVSSGAW